MTRVQGFPITVQVDSSFTDEHRKLIQRAADDWNNLAQTALGQPAFEVSDPVDLDPAMRTMDPHDCGQSFGSAQVLTIVREKSLDHWQSIGFSSQVPGATMRCSSGGQVTQQITLVDTELAPRKGENGMTSDALLRVFTHELGHSLGLDHSCNGNSTVSRPTYISCTGLAPSDPYRQAVMFPWIQPDYFSGSAKKEVSAPASLLRDNDKSRGTCIMRAS